VKKKPAPKKRASKLAAKRPPAARASVAATKSALPQGRVRRFGQLIGLRPERLFEYKRYHAAVWPEILAALRKAEIRNYSIFHFDGRLFAYFEYHGPPAEYEERMRKVARAPRMREWWDIMDPMQVPVEGRNPGGWWADMEEVFHTD
jgi:L-rhamnose mutarotase